MKTIGLTFPKSEQPKNADGGKQDKNTKSEQPKK